MLRGFKRDGPVRPWLDGSHLNSKSPMTASMSAASTSPELSTSPFCMVTEPTTWLDPVKLMLITLLRNEEPSRTNWEAPLTIIEKLIDRGVLLALAASAHPSFGLTVFLLRSAPHQWVPGFAIKTQLDLLIEKLHIRLSFLPLRDVRYIRNEWKALIVNT